MNDRVHRFPRIVFSLLPLAVLAFATMPASGSPTYEPTLASATTGGGAVTLFATGHVGADGLSTLFTVDPGTGVATTVGPIGFERCGSMDADSLGDLYAVCERTDGTNTAVLVSIDDATGAGTEIGPTGFPGSTSDISFRPSDGVLFAYDATNAPEHTVYTIDTATGAGTAVGSTGLSSASGNAMSFDNGGTLFHSQTVMGTVNLNTVDPATGVATFMMVLPIPPPPPTNNYRFNSMDADPSMDVLYAVLNDGSLGGGPRFLTTIDTGAGIVTVIGPTEDSLDGLTWAAADLSRIFFDGFESGDTSRWSSTTP